MTKFEDIKAGTQLTGLLPNQSVTVVNLEWHGNEVITLTYRDQSCNLSEGLVYRDQEADLNILKQGLNWSFDADGELFRLAAEAYRIRQAYLFDPYLLGLY